jgi:hypothetical protein
MLREKLAALLPEPRVIYDREGGTPYLSRWYLIGAQRPVDPLLKGSLSDETPSFWQRLPINLYLHRFHRSDDDGALHSHPWSWAMSFILAHGYSEERRVGDEVIRRRIRPLTFNFIRGEDYHRVDLLDGKQAWSLFLVGPKTDTSWYFWDRDKKARCGWRSFITAKHAGEEPPWEPDSRELSAT